MRIIAGPCQHEGLAQSADIVRECKRVCDLYGIEYYFKASYDKANRTSINSARGMGMEATLEDFCALKEEYNINTLTDVHDYVQVNRIEREFKDAVDVYQIPAFLCRQTDLIVYACATDKIVNIKKGQFLAPWDIEGILSKTKNAKEVWITERGICHGYNNLVVDFNGMQYMLDSYNVPLVFDATHSVQRPSANGVSSGGNRNHVAGLTRAASALGVSNFFLEVHDDPDNAPSDGDNMLYLKDFERTINDIMRYSYTR